MHRFVTCLRSPDELNAFKAAGGGTVVDVTPPGLGRDNHVHKLPRVSKISRVNIVAATGQCVEATYPPRIKEQTAVQVAQDFIKEITEWIMETGIKAGVIKTCLSPNRFGDADNAWDDLSVRRLSDGRRPGEADVASRRNGWLHEATKVVADYEDWRKGHS